MNALIRYVGPIGRVLIVGAVAVALASTIAMASLGLAQQNPPDRPASPSASVDGKGTKPMETVPQPDLNALYRQLSEELSRVEAIRKQQPNNDLAIEKKADAMRSLGEQLAKASASASKSPAAQPEPTKIGSTAPPKKPDQPKPPVKPSSRPDPEELDRRLDRTYLRPSPGVTSPAAKAKIEITEDPQTVRKSSETIRDRAREIQSLLQTVQKAGRGPTAEEWQFVDQTTARIRQEIQAMAKDRDKDQAENDQDDKDNQDKAKKSKPAPTPIPPSNGSAPTRA